MRHVVISDTHAPQMIDSAYQYLAKQNLDNVDSIVINGDLLGAFSMTGSNLHKSSGISFSQKKDYLEACAPKFFSQIRAGQPLSADMVLAYVRERYEWVIATLKQFSELKHTIWNMGNHESEQHFLVLQELSFLLDLPQGALSKIPDSALREIFQWHERQLLGMQLTHDFLYLSKSPKLIGDSLLVAIPGESHAANGNSLPALVQEQVTASLLSQAKDMLAKASRVVIYNHTQGSYDKSTATFEPASPTAKNFLESTTDKQSVWVQSHNHWSHTQFFHHEGTDFIMNNAGLHGGIFNIIEYGRTGTRVWDVDPNLGKKTLLSQRIGGVNDTDQLEVIKTNYPNALDIFMSRRTSMLQHAADPDNARLLVQRSTLHAKH